MAVVAIKSASTTARDLGQQVNPFLGGCSAESTTDIAAVTSGDSIASVYRLVRVPSNARMAALNLFTTPITTCAGDTGLYQTAANGGAVVDADFFSAATSLASPSAGLNVLGGNVLAAGNRNKRLWEALGLTADPMRDYDIAVTLTAAAGSAGTIGVEALYTR